MTHMLAELEIEPDERTWLERMRDDASLRVFVEAEIARAGIALAAAKAEAAHWRMVADRLAAKLDEALPSSERARQSNRDRQFAFRRRHQFAPPLVDAPPRTKEGCPIERELRKRLDRTLESCAGRRAAGSTRARRFAKPTRPVDRVKTLRKSMNSERTVAYRALTRLGK